MLVKIMGRNMSLNCIIHFESKVHPDKIKNLFPNSKIQRVSTTNISWLMVFKEVTSVYTENNSTPTNTKCKFIYC
jgi:hypothetical protein